MGTEQQQEFKSEKQTTKQKRKVIPFTDHSIEAWRPKKDKDRIGFVLSNATKGIKVIYRKKTNQKYWELTYYLKKREKDEYERALEELGEDSSEYEYY